MMTWGKINTARKKQTNASDRSAIANSSNFVALEQIVLIAFGTVAALQAANKEYRHTNSDKDGEDTRVDP